MKRVLLREKTQYINPVMDAYKLRMYTASFKRHAINRYIRPENLNPHQLMRESKMRQSVTDYFFQYCRQVIPRIEEKIELQLLEKFKDSLESEAEKKEVIHAYWQRKENLAKYHEGRDIGITEREPPKGKFS